MAESRIERRLAAILAVDVAGYSRLMGADEAMYRIDRSLFHITSNAGIRRVSGLMLGRCSAITPNEPDFGMNEEEIARYWCRKSGIPWLGRADIGHDANNKIVPFGSLRMTGATRVGA
jgi:muramoyltetrapeptide carboxypeptidase